MHLYSATSSAHQSEARPLRKTKREEDSLKVTKEAHVSQVNKVDRVEGESWFQSTGQLVAFETKRPCRSSQRNGQRGMAEEDKRKRARKYIIIFGSLSNDQYAIGRLM